jgi:NTP pyrophosphohydrolases including oxidative damage repair enzymes
MHELAHLCARFILRHSPPGQSARMTHSAKPAAVLLILTPSTTEGEIDLLLIRRPLWLRHHPGQLAFPGGKRDPEDESLLETAMRETHEELGISLPKQKILGTLPGQLTVSGFYITPFVIALDLLPEMKLASDEVAEVIRLPLSSFHKAGAYRPIAIRRNRQIHQIPAYWVKGELVWGATASIIHDLLAHLDLELPDENT